MGKRHREQLGGEQTVSLVERGDFGTLGELVRDKIGGLDIAECPEKSIKIIFRGQDYIVPLNKNNEEASFRLLKVFLKAINKHGAEVGDRFISMLNEVETFYAENHKIKSKIVEIKTALGLSENSVASADVPTIDESTFAEWLDRFGKKWKGKVSERKRHELKDCISTGELNDSIKKDYPGADIANLNALLEKLREKLDTAPFSPSPEPENSVEEEKISVARPTLEEIKQETEAIRKEVDDAEEGEGHQAAVQRYERILRNIKLFLRFKRYPQEIELYPDQQEKFDKYYSNYQAEDFIALLKELGEWRERQTERPQLEDIQEKTREIMDYKERKGIDYFNAACRRIDKLSEMKEEDLNDDINNFLRIHYSGWKVPNDFIALRSELEKIEMKEGQEDENNISLEAIRSMAKEVIKLKERDLDLYESVMDAIIELSQSENDEVPENLEGMKNQFFLDWLVPENFEELLDEIEKLEAEEGEGEKLSHHDSKIVEPLKQSTEEEKQAGIKLHIERMLNASQERQTQRILTFDEIEEIKTTLQKLIDKSGLKDNVEKNKWTEKVKKMVKVATWKRKKYNEVVSLNDDELNKFLESLKFDITAIAKDDTDIREIVGIPDFANLYSALIEEKARREADHSKKSNTELKEKPQKEAIKLREKGPCAELEDLLDDMKAKEMLRDIIAGLSLDRPNNTIFSVNQKLMKQALDRINDDRKIGKQKKKELMDFLIDNNDDEDNFAESFIKLAKHLNN